MDLMNRLVITLVALTIAGSIDIVFFTTSYGLLRLVRIPVRWVTLAIGWFIITVGVVATLAGPFYPSAIGLAGIMGSSRLASASMHSKSGWPVAGISR